MLRDSMDAIRQLLNTTFPDVDRVYVNSVPAGFKRPSFFIGLISESKSHINKAMYQTRITWQIIYFAPDDGADNPNVFDQLTVTEKLKTALMEGMDITGPSGTVYNILDCSGGSRDAEVYINVRLEAIQRRPEEEFDVMNDITHDFKEGN